MPGKGRRSWDVKTYWYGHSGGDFNLLEVIWSCSDNSRCMNLTSTSDRVRIFASEVFDPNLLQYDHTPNCNRMLPDLLFVNFPEIVVNRCSRCSLPKDRYLSVICLSFHNVLAQYDSPPHLACFHNVLNLAISTSVRIRKAPLQITCPPRLNEVVTYYKKKETFRKIYEKCFCVRTIL